MRRPGQRRPVLVLDNCEHVVEPVRDVAAALVAACPGLTVLATSREPLGLTAEHLLRLGPLPVPEQGTADVTGVPAVEAFLAHARRRQPDLVLSRDDAALVGDVVRRLDGLPLALELAAGRLGTLSLVDLQARLDRALDLFSAGRRSADARHRSLRDAIDWSARPSTTTRPHCCAPSVPSPAASTWPPPSDWPTGRAYGPIPPGRWPPRRRVDAGHGGRCVRGAATVPRDRPGLHARPARRHRASAPRRVKLVAWAVDLTAEIDRLTTGPDEPAADAQAAPSWPTSAPPGTWPGATTTSTPGWRCC